MAIVAFIGAYCISLLASSILRPFVGVQPLLFNLIMNIILVIGLTYFAMPLESRLLRRWLYPKNLWSLLAHKVLTNAIEKIKCYWNVIQKVWSDRNRREWLDSRVLTALHLQKKFGIVAVHDYFNSLSLLEKFPISSTSRIKKDSILSRNANLPVESVLQTALPTPRNTGLPFFVVVFPTCRKV